MKLAERMVHAQRDAQLLEEKLQRAAKCVAKARSAVRNSSNFDQTILSEMENDMEVRLNSFYFIS